MGVPALITSWMVLPPEVSREHFAATLGTTLQSVTRWERGGSPPGPMACKLLSFLAQERVDGEESSAVAAIGAVEAVVLEHILSELLEIKSLLCTQKETKRE